MLQENSCTMLEVWIPSCCMHCSLPHQNTSNQPWQQPCTFPIMQHQTLMPRSTTSLLMQHSRLKAMQCAWFAMKPEAETVVTNVFHVAAKMVMNVMASAAEAEDTACCVSAQDDAPLKQFLEDLGHEQPATTTNKRRNATP